MPLNPKVEDKTTYICNSCQAELRRKPTEGFPRACNYCHAENATFKVRP